VAPPVTIELWDLAAAEAERRFSPYCWRIKLALRHKDLPFSTVPWRMVEKDRIAFSGQGKVPVIRDGETTVFDSWTIANYLEDTYPDRPSLFRGEGGRALGRFICDWTDATVLGGVFPMIAADIAAHLDPGDQGYFRATREKFLGRSLEDAQGDREARVEAFRTALTPLRRMLRHQPFIAGPLPAWADYAVFGVFQWARCVSPFRLLTADDPVHAWRERMFDLFDGEARRAVGYAA
jgi:glutathione S-transferase